MVNKKFTYRILPEHANKRLDLFLTGQKELGQTRSQLRRLIDEGLVKVNGQQGKASQKLKENDAVALEIPPPVDLDAKPENIPLDIVFEDRDIIVVNKPRGLVVHPAAGNQTGTLVNALLHHVPDLAGIGGVARPGIVHRLDKDTSGLIVVAKNDLAHQSLTKQFKDKTIYKQYLALVYGVVKSDSGVIDKPIGRHPRFRQKMAVFDDYSSSHSREAVTEFKVLERFKGFSLLECVIKTGRTHQIRVHLASINHPVVGDPLYGPSRQKFNVGGQLLHAASLSFDHPRTGKRLDFSVGMPAEMGRVIKVLEPLN